MPEQPIPLVPKAAADASGQAESPVLDTDNRTPFAVAPLFWEDLEGRPRLTVLVKATFTILPGKNPAPAARQLPILTADVLNGDGPNATVRLESDLVPFKPRADVVLVGRAHAPYGRPVPELDVTLKVGRLARTIRVIGDRQWKFSSKLALAPHVTPPQPFAAMDLVYERAFGGIDGPAARYCPENLAGTGFIGKNVWECIQDKRLPNLEDPRDLIRWPKSHPKPVGFGFYGRGWQPRLAHAGTYDERYRKERAPALPADFSYALFNGAHPDLQVEGYLRGDEEVELENLSPEPKLRFRLPGVRPRLTVFKRTGDVATPSPETVPVVLDTLVLVPDEELFYLVYRGNCPLARLDAAEVARVQVA